MTPKQRISIACGVVALGVVAALLFRRPGKVEDAGVLTTAVVPASVSQPRSLTESHEVQPPREAVPAAAKTAATPAAVVAAPSSPETTTPEDPYPWVDPVPPKLDLRHPGESDPFADHPFESEEKPSDSARRWRKHRVHDGDTLRTLARRYLGDANRASEILDANRERLPNPDVLPIGVELEIPLARDGASAR